MYSVLVALADQQPRARAVRDTLTGAYERLEQYQADEHDRAAYEKLLEALTRLEQATTALTGRLPELPYPFDHAAGAITLRRFATDDLPELGDVKQGAVPRAQSVLQRLFLLYQRALARTAVIAQRAERAAEEAEGSPGGVRTSYSSQRDR
jgi:hypothetical protein